MIRKAALALALATTSATFAGQAMAQGVEGYDDVGARIGFVDVDHYGMSYTLGLFADFGLAKMFSLGIGLDYFDDTKDEGDSITNEARDISFTTLGRFVIPTRSGILPFVEAGLSLHMVKFETDFGHGTGRASVSDNDSKLGLDIGGGVIIPSRSSIGWVIEAIYRETGSLDIDHLMVTGGITKSI